MMFCDDEAAFKTQLEAVKRRAPDPRQLPPWARLLRPRPQRRFFNNVREMASEIDAPMVFETHRTRCLFRRGRRSGS
jgi:hypothetical protein